MNLSEGSSEHPLLRKSQIKGLAVGLVRRYPFEGRLSRGEPFRNRVFLSGFYTQ